MIKFYIPHRLKDEKIILLLRRHWFIILKKIVFWGIIAIMPLVFYFILNDFVEGLISNESIYPIFILFISIYYLYVWLFAFYSFVDYYLDIWIVTSERIINIEQKGLFAREVSEQRLYRIQDVTSELKGFFPTILNYGTVYIQTASETPHFIFKEVSTPQEVAKKISQIVEQNKKFHRLMEQEDKITTHH